MHVLVTGATGLLGCELVETLTTMGADVDGRSKAGLDITDGEQVFRVVDAGDYDVVFNCAAYTNVDGCEQAEDKAFRVNAEGARNVARACAQDQVRLVHFSTDYVFSGDIDRPYREDDETGPLNAYGRTKLAGEQMVLDECPDALVLRTSWLYGAHGGSFVRTMLRLGATRDFVEVVDDQVGCLTNSRDLARAALALATKPMQGICHCAGAGAASWADVAEAVFSYAHLGCDVRRCSTEAYCSAHPQAAVRPRYSALGNRRLEDAGLGALMRPWCEALQEFVGGELS